MDVGVWSVVQVRVGRTTHARPPVCGHLVSKSGLMETLQQPQLRGGAVVDAHVREAPIDMLPEALGEEAAAIVGHQER